MRKLVAVVVCIVTMFSIAIADESYYVMCHPDSFVNVRKSPSKNGTIVGCLYYGDEVKADGKTKNGFIHVVGLSLEDDEGWVRNLYLDLWKPMDDVIGEYTVVSKGRVAIRNGVNGKRTGWLKSGSDVFVYGMSAEWAVTNKGYVKSEYLERSE